MTSLTPSIFDLPRVSQPSDGVPSDTLTEQLETERLITELLAVLTPPATPADAPAAGAEGSKDARAIPPTSTVLRKGEHVGYICSTMFKLPAPYVSLDASRPWLMFWTMHSLDLLGCALDQPTQARSVS